jgi:hypothetical protein
MYHDKMCEQRRSLLPDENLLPILPTKTVVYYTRDVNKYDLKPSSVVFYSDILDYIDTAINHPSSSSTQI